LLDAVKPGAVFHRVARNEIFRHGAIVFAGLSVNNALNFVFHFSMTRMLGVQSYAVLSSLISVSFVAVIPAAVAVTVVAKYAAQYNALGERAKLWALIRRVLAGSTITAILVFGGGSAVREPIGAFLHIADPLALTLCLGIIAVMFIEPVLRGVLQGVEDFASYGISYAIEGIGKLACAIVLVRAGYGVDGALLGALLGSLVALAYTIRPIISYRVTGAQTYVHFDIVRLIVLTSGSAVGMASMSLLGFMDMLFVKHYFSAEQAGIYAAASLAGKIVYFMVGFAPTILLPKASAHSRIGGSPVRLLAQAGALTGVISLATLVVFAFAPHLVITAIAGAKYEGAASFVLGYGCAMAFLAAANLVINYKIGMHQFDFVIPAITIPIAEAVGISMYHQSLLNVVTVLLVGHALMFLGTLFRVGGSVRIEGALGVADAA
jgi:O-antigen/teichoic acid export membrane protein